MNETILNGLFGTHLKQNSLIGGRVSAYLITVITLRWGEGVLQLN